MAKVDSSLQHLLQAQQVKENGKISSRKRLLFKAMALAAAVPLALGLYYRDGAELDASLNARHKPSFSDACNIPEVRQRFLDNLLCQEHIPYCDGVVYDDDGSRIKASYNEELKACGLSSKDVTQEIGLDSTDTRQGNYELRTSEILDSSGQGRHTKIFVGKKTFDNNGFFKDGEELKQAIVAHEGRHVERYCKGIDYLIKTNILAAINSGEIGFLVFYAVGEYDAIAHELHSTLKGKFNVSTNYIQNRKLKLIEYESRLKSISKLSSQTQRKFIEDTRNAMYDKFPELRDIIY